MRRIAWCLVQRGDNQPLDLGIAHLAWSPRPRLIQKDHRVGVPQSGYLIGDEGKGFKYILDGRELDRAFHQIHHSPTRIETSTAFYKHPVGIAINSTIASSIVFLLLGGSYEAAGWYNVFAAGGEMFYHSNLRNHIGAAGSFNDLSTTRSITSSTSMISTLGHHVVGQALRHIQGHEYVRPEVRFPQCGGGAAWCHVPGQRCLSRW